MCLATPVLILDIQGTRGLVEIGGMRRVVSLALTPQAKPGDYVLIHAGYAIGTLDEKEAEETLRLLGQMEDLSDAGGRDPSSIS
ncbi:MAG: HypC/HybG/HupF family hydrogenase formation chaperone [Deltaproteobacteria bacterium]|nr:HypC/HybG/HupF family hydrogenase formation chaperone [Deltaproteobacteria bacterium]